MQFPELAGDSKATAVANAGVHDGTIGNHQYGTKLYNLRSLPLHTFPPLDLRRVLRPQNRVLLPNR